MEDIKPPTLLDSSFFKPDSIVKEEERLLRIATKEEIVHETEKLEVELQEIEKKKKEGYDVYENCNILKRKFKILEEVKERIVGAEKLKLKEEKLKLEKRANHEKLDDNRKSIDFQNSNQPKNNRERPDDRNLFKYLNEIMNRKINLYLLFHCCVFKKQKRIEDFKAKLANFLEKNRYVKIAFSAFYPDMIEKTPERKFHDHKSFSRVSLTKDVNIRELKNIRNEILDIYSNDKEHSVLCNIVALDCTHRKKEIVEFINGIKDPVQELLDYKEITVRTFKINETDTNRENQKTLENIDSFFDESNLNKIVVWKKNSVLAEALFNLKRNKINSVDGYEEFMKSKSLNVKKKKKLYKNQTAFMKRRVSVHFDDIFDRKVQSNKYCAEKETFILHVENEIQISTNYHAYFAKVHEDKFFCKPKTYFLDVFDNDVCFIFLEIHETAKFFVQEFHKYIGEEIILIPEAKMFSTTDSVYSIFGMTNHITTVFTSKNDAKISFKTENPIMQAFLHFCYVFSKETTVVIDLRTIKFHKYLMLTEPIILSSIDKYGSSNLGLDAIKYLMSGHKCNNYCEKFKNI